MLSSEKTEFTLENIDDYLNALSKEYKKMGGRNTPVEIILIGGAAVIENYGFRNATTDIDAVLPAAGIFKDAINRVGDKLGLPNGWLNDDFKKTASYTPKISLYSKPYKTFNQVLNVRTLSGEYLIAMKLRSARKYKNDLSDVAGILAAQEKGKKPLTFEDITKAVNDLYGGWDDFDPKSTEILNGILKNKDFEKDYQKIRSKEIENKEKLLKFEEKYPGVLTSENLENILDNTKEKKVKSESLLSRIEILKKLQEANQKDPKRKPKEPER